MKTIQKDGIWFTDHDGRKMILRGINLGGSTKMPYKPYVVSHVREGFISGNVSFVGRPFPIDEADEHFQRIRTWGFRFLRFLITWEAIEHDNPGIYDEEYIDYVCRIIEKAGNYGISVFIDPHQDVWSRFSGGDGAPLWTLEQAGFNVENFVETNGAMVHNLYGDPFPKMIWPGNYHKLVSATMFTLFFAGHDLAPNTTIDGEDMKTYLQGHYIRSVKELARKVNRFPNVIGFDTLNEPSSGWIGLNDLNAEPWGAFMGPCPTAFQAMLLGSGHPQTLKVYEDGVHVGEKVVNKNGARAWKKNHECIWKKNGIWGYNKSNEPVILKPDHFSQMNKHKINFAKDYFKPFVNRFAQEIQGVDKEFMIFVETTVENRQLPEWTLQDAPNIVNADHWYDHDVLLTKKYSKDYMGPMQTGMEVYGAKNIDKAFREQLGIFKRSGDNTLGGIPTLIGEFGIPFDMNDRKAYNTGDFSEQVAALDRSFRAIESNLLNCTLWNYTADNTNERGDQWNGEDLSIYSIDQRDHPRDINSGGRALKAAIRPYPYKVSGTPLFVMFDIHQQVFEFEFKHDPQVPSPTLLFIPEFHFSTNYKVEVTDGKWEKDIPNQLLLYYPTNDREVHKIKVCRNQETDKDVL